MFQTANEYADRFKKLPDQLKGLIYVFIIALVFLCLYFIGGDWINSKRSERLEKENIEISNKAEVALDRMKAAEINAASERMRAEMLELALNEVNVKTKTQDEKISNNRNSLSAARNNLNHVRSSEPKRADADALARRLEARYGDAKNTRSRQ